MKLNKYLGYIAGIYMAMSSIIIFWIFLEAWFHPPDYYTVVYVNYYGEMWIELPVITIMFVAFCIWSYVYVKNWFNGLKEKKQ